LAARRSYLVRIFKLINGNDVGRTGCLNRNACRTTVQEWAGRIEVSERTLSRLLLQETGLSFGWWRQQFHVVLALQWLSQGGSVQSVATVLGYESASSFVFMFRKALGSSPARSITQRLAGSPTAPS
jgi:AraC-like DNA-binding protein